MLWRERRGRRAPEGSRPPGSASARYSRRRRAPVRQGDEGQDWRKTRADLSSEPIAGARRAERPGRPRRGVLRIIGGGGRRGEASYSSTGPAHRHDRKGVVEGKGVYVRVALGGRRILKNKKNIQTDTIIIVTKA